MSNKKIVLITGASSGFGLQMIRKFVQNGFFVIGIARRANLLEKISEEIGDAGFS
jgi:3-hydroxy acid dehydrogenase/malonic semialdehyde reductase